MSFPADDAIQESPSKNKNTDLAQAAARSGSRKYDNVFNSWLSKCISSLNIKDYKLAKFYFGKVIEIGSRPISLAYHALANIHNMQTDYNGTISYYKKF